jgi:hypothetical protein
MERDKTREYTKGMVYFSESKGCITDNSGDVGHYINADCFKEHFMELAEEKITSHNSDYAAAFEKWLDGVKDRITIQEVFEFYRISESLNSAKAPNCA